MTELWQFLCFWQLLTAVNRCLTAVYFLMLMCMNVGRCYFCYFGCLHLCRFGTNLLTKGGDVSKNLPLSRVRSTRDRGRFLLTSPTFVRRLFILQWLSRREVDQTLVQASEASQGGKVFTDTTALSGSVSKNLTCTRIMRVNHWNETTLEVWSVTWSEDRNGKV